MLIKCVIDITQSSKTVVPNLFSVMDSFDDLAGGCGPP